MNRTRILIIAAAILLLLSVGLWQLFGHSPRPEPENIVCKLPKIVEETSGIETASDGMIWTFNDSGGEPELYLCDTTGKLVRTLFIAGAWNRDWEDMTQDDQGNIYIGNMGNNANDNTDLSIFKIPNPDQLTSDTAHAEVILFAFEDQTDFPPSEEEMNFDCESLVWFDSALYLCSKHRSFPMATKLYRIPDSAGTYTAKKISRFETGTAKEGEDPTFDYWITAADLSPDQSRFAMISSNKIWLFRDFEGDDFFSGDLQVIEFSPSTQKEAVCFADNETLYITDEYWKRDRIGRNLYKISLNE